MWRIPECLNGTTGRGRLNQFTAGFVPKPAEFSVKGGFFLTWLSGRIDWSVRSGVWYNPRNHSSIIVWDAAMTSADLNPEILTTAAHETEAALIISRLGEEGIRATVGGDFPFAFRADIPRQINVIVARSDLDRAKVLLKTMKTDRADIDWSQVDVGQPDEE